MASMKKTFWNEYIRASAKDRDLLKQEYSVSSFDPKKKEYEKLTNDNLQYCNALAHALRQIIKPRQKNYHSKLVKLFVIGKFYKWYHRINGHTFKYNGPIIIITKDGTEYPNTRYYRTVKLNRLIR